jgi:hypothetical protein
MYHPLRCRCGSIRGSVRVTGSENRVLCYCRDCQAFARFLGRADSILDRQGGSNIVQTLPACVTINTGKDSLACMRLTPKGLLRWYARCCNTPIGNTLDSPRISFIGLVHSCLQVDEQTIDAAFGPVCMWVYTRSALGNPKPHKQVPIGGMLRMVFAVIRARLNGSYRQTPFFSFETGAPAARPRVLTAEERHALN